MDDMDADSLVFRLGENAPEMLREVCEELGWREFESDEDDDDNWNLWWKASGFRTSDFQCCRPWQRLNHFPKSFLITRKDSLARNLRKMRWIYGSGLYNFAPMAFNLPNDYRKFVAEYSKQKEGKRNLWICKPADLSRGRGIFLFRELKDLTYNCAAVVQKYIPNPLLISGYKFDLRLYVLVTSFHPFTVYIYHEGLVRFGTEKFDLSSTDNVFSHLTNTSINKLGPSYSAEKDRVGVGCKWSLKQLRAYFHQHSIDDRLLWQRITSLVVLTLLMQAPEVPNDRSNHCFELFGFDVLVDDNLKPWLLEVNFSPALGNDCPLDIAVKKPMLRDMIQALGFTEADVLQTPKKHKGQTQKSRPTARKTPLIQPRSSLKTRSTTQKHCSNTSQCKVQGKGNTCRSRKSTGDACLDYVSGIDLPTTEEDSGETVHNAEVNVTGDDSHTSTTSQLDSSVGGVAECLDIPPVGDLAYTEVKLSNTKASFEFLAAFESDNNYPCQQAQNSSVYSVVGPAGADIVFEEASPRQSVDLETVGGGRPSTWKNEKLPSVVDGAISALSTACELGKRKKNGKVGQKASLRIRRTQSVLTTRVPEDFIMRRLSTTTANLRNSSGSNVSRYAGSATYGGFATGRHCPQLPSKRRNGSSCRDAKPSARFGNYILVFPFNESTCGAAQGSINIKLIAEEIRLAMKALTSCQTPDGAGRKDAFETLELDKPFWSLRPNVWPEII